MSIQHVDNGRIYLSVQGISPSRRFLGALQKTFADRGFVIASKPSAANLIMQISICHAGAMNRSDAKRALESGYDSKVGITGDEVAGLVVDTLLVTREVPQARSDEQRKLKTISQRRASGSSTLRLVFLSKKGISMRPVPLSFAHHLGETLCGYLDQEIDNKR
ncbi:MAG: hypothetical protein J5846_00285 [Desulfovibrio sp.]|nr:hypothetical protein [Desulfovibrio sp.]